MLMVMVMVMFRARQNAIWNPYRMWENSMPKHREVLGVGRGGCGANQRFIVKELYVRDVSFQHYGLSNFV
jgi:hypothetical protein